MRLGKNIAAGLGRNTMRRMTGFSMLGAIGVLLAGCSTVPDHSDAWLSYKYSFTCGVPHLDAGGGTSDAGTCLDDAFGYDAANYYSGLGIANPLAYTYHFSDWLAANGFPPDGSTDAHAVYGNLADLQVGRDMHCLQNGQKIACYVSNFGSPPMFWNWDTKYGTTWVLQQNVSWPNITDAVEAPLVPHAPFGRVAMVYDPAINGPNQVSFYAFGTAFINGGDGTDLGDDVLLPRIALDQEGQKSVPRMCMACHGGTYDANTDTATGASFLPFDVFAFRFPKEAGYSLDDQQEALRKLNALVLATNPTKPIQDLINGMYPGGVAQDGYVPTGWSGDPTLYTGVIRPYCRMCHLAQPAPFTSSSDFADLAGNVSHEVCSKHTMPHSQVAYGLNGKKIGFWNDRVAQQDLGNFLKAAGVASCLPAD